MSDASIVTDFWNNLEEHNEQGIFLVLVGFLGSFAFIRMSTRIIRSEAISWWPGNIESEGGVHVHHLVFGIVTMMVAGTLAFVADGRTPYTEICALGFGIGVGLTIDEFALWVHLEDVYWEREGRSSIDATVIAAAAMLLVMVGTNPIAIESGSPELFVASILSTLFVFAMVAICVFKGRILHAVVGFFVFPVAIYGASRIGKPESTWARRRYGVRRPKKQAKAEDRFRPDRRTERFKEAFRDIVGGKPSEGLAKVGDEAIAATRETTAEVRQRAEEAVHAADPTQRNKR
jgi:lysyl-tRNA synthetase class 2